MNPLKSLFVIIIFLCSSIMSCYSAEYLLKDKFHQQNFDTTINGKKVELYFLKNEPLEMVVTNYGGRIVALNVPDFYGNLVDVVLGCDHINQYLMPGAEYFGAIIGRYANRIANGLLVLGTDTFKLPKNNNGNCLHGGPDGFHSKIWALESISDSSIQLSLISENGDQGFPGELKVNASYTLRAEGQLEVNFLARSNQTTVVNLTQHSYFNLNGEGNGDILNHELLINSDSVIEVNQIQIPIQIVSVKNSPFDFINSEIIGKRIDSENNQLRIGNGYDHYFILNQNKTKSVLVNAGYLYSDKTRIEMSIFTNQPGLQLYTGNYIDNNVGKGNKKYKFRTGVCLEANQYPDAPNQSAFPSTKLNPGEEYQQTTIFKFKVR